MPHSRRPKAVPQWTFLTNHAHVLLCIVRSPSILMRDLAAQVGITERAVQRIVADLQQAGYLTTERHGRRNRYGARTDLPLRHPLEQHRSVAGLIDLLLDLPPAPSERPVKSGTGAAKRLPAHAAQPPSLPQPQPRPRARPKRRPAAPSPKPYRPSGFGSFE